MISVKVIGITGPTGAGKTTALKEIERLGGRVLDADAVYHRLLAEDQPLQLQLESMFGPLRDGHGAIDRKKLGAIVFGDPKKLSGLNTVTHRAVGGRIHSLLKEYETQGCPLAAVDAIALLESGLGERCDVTVAVTAPPEVRVRRIMAREGISEDYARARVAAQKPDDFYIGGCDYALVNDCATAEEFAARAGELFQQILEQQDHGPCGGKSI